MTNIRLYLEPINEHIREGKLEEAKELVDLIDNYMKKISGAAPACCHSTVREKEGKLIEMCSKEGDLIIECSQIRAKKEDFQKFCKNHCQKYILEQIPNFYKEIEEKRI